MKRCMQLVLSVVFVLGMAATAMAGGFSIYEWSARGDAMGGTMIGRADDASAAVYNPAGMTQIEGKEVIVGAAWLSPRVEVHTSDGRIQEAKELKHYVPHGYAAMQVNDKMWLGLAANTRFGLANEYDEGWFGSGNIYKASLKTYSVSPSVAMKLLDNLSLGFGLEFMRANVDLRQKAKLNSAITLRDTELTGSAYGFGYNLSTRYEPTDWMAVGAVFHSAVDLSFDGEIESARYTNVPGLISDANLPVGTFAAGAHITLPESFSLGVVVEPTDDFSIEVDAIRTFWSSYDKIDVNFPSHDPVLEATYGRPKYKEWKDVWRLQVGAEYDVTDSFVVRAGYVYDEAPNNDHPDFMVIPGDKQILFGGMGYTWNDFTVDAAYGYLWGETFDASVHDSMTTTQDVTFKNADTHIVNLSFKYAF